MLDITKPLGEIEQQTFNEVDNIVSRAVMIGDPVMAMEYGRSLIGTMKLKSYALAKLLYMLKQNWELFQIGGIDDDLLSMADSMMGVAPETTTKYIRMWQSIFENQDIDEETKTILIGRPISETLLLTAAASDGSLDRDEMKEAALTADKTALRDLIREKRGEKTSSGSAVKIMIYMRDRSDVTEGTVVAIHGDEKEILFTFNKVHTEFAEKAIERIINASRMMEIY